jgi:hypothetical protein
MFDCVQFPRRGWVHRNRFQTASGASDWLTLPIAKAPQDVLIRDLTFANNAHDQIEAAAQRFPALKHALHTGHPLAERILAINSDDVATYLIALVTEFAGRLGFERKVVRSSSLSVPGELRAQDRVIAILHALGATSYVNPSGGRELYDHATFGANGLELQFLAPYTSSMDSILARMLKGPIDAIADEIRRETILMA